MSVPPKDLLNYLDQKSWGTNPSAGASSWSNRGSLSAPELSAWRQKLLNTPEDLRDPAEVAGFNEYWNKPVPGVNIRIGGGQKPITTNWQMPAGLGENAVMPTEPTAPAAPDMSQNSQPSPMPSESSYVGSASESDPYGSIEAGLLNAAKFEADAAKNTYNTSRKIALQEQAALQGRIDASDAYAAQMQKINEEKDARIASEMSKLDELGKKAADGKVTPFWDKASTEQKVGAGLAMALGAFGSSFSKGPNYAMQIIDKAIDDDIKAQMANIDQNNKAFSNQREHIGELKSIYRDRTDMAAALRSMAYDKVENQLMSIASKNKELMALPAFQQQLAKIQENKIATQMSLSKSRADTMKLEREASGQTPENFIPGYGYAPSKKVAEDGMALNQITTEMLGDLAELKRMREAWGKNALNPDEVGRAKAIATNLIFNLKSDSMAKLGVLAGPDLDLLTTIIPMNPMGPGFVMSKLNQAEQIIKNKRDAFYKSRGFINPSNQQQQQGQAPQQSGPSPEQWIEWSRARLLKNPRDQEALQVYHEAKRRLGKK
jgi:hypothetical protein